MIIYIIFLALIITLFIWLWFLYKKQKSILAQLDGALKSNDKNWINYDVATKLLHGMQSSNEIVKRVEQYGFSNIAVYGMGPIGRFLVKELLKEGIQVPYAIDQNAELIYADVPVYNTKDVFPQVDAVIVTAVYYCEQVKSTLEDKVKCPIVSLYDFLI